MTVYSHSRLSSFEQCPYKFKLRYIDKVETEVEESVETFMGIRVHETLEKLYSDLRYQKKNSLEDLLVYLNDEWKKNITKMIISISQFLGQPASAIEIHPGATVYELKALDV